MTSATAKPLWTVALAGMVTMAVGMGIGRFAFTPILPQMMAERGIDAAQAGLIASANYAGYLVGAVLAAFGWASGHERRIAIGAIAANTVLLAAMAVADDVAAFALLRFAAGLASAFLMIFSAGIVLGYGAHAGRPIVQSVHFGGVGIGMALSAVLVGALGFAGQGSVQSWLAMAALSACGLLFAIAFLPAPVPAVSGASGREQPLTWSPRLVALTAGYGIFGFGYIVTATFLIAIIRSDGGSVGFEALVWLLTGLAAAVSVAAAQPLVKRFGVAKVMAAGCLVEALGVAASVLLPSPLGPLVGGFLLGATFVVITAYGLQFARSLAPDSQRRSLSFMTAAFGIGQIVGPVVAGYLAERSGSYLIASLLAAFALILSAALVVRSARA